MSNSEGIKYKNFCIIIYSPSFTTIIKNIKKYSKIYLTDKNTYYIINNITCNSLKYYLHLNVTVVCYKRKTLFDIIVVLFINKNMLVMYILHHNLYNVTMFTNL